MESQRASRADGRFVTLQQLAEEYRWPLGGLKYWMFHREKNGLSSAVIKLGKKVLIDRDAFEAWLKSHGTKGGAR